MFVLQVLGQLTDSSSEDGDLKVSASGVVFVLLERSYVHLLCQNLRFGRCLIVFYFFAHVESNASIQLNYQIALSCGEDGRKPISPPLAMRN